MADEFDQYLESSTGVDLAIKHAVLYEKGVDPATDPKAKSEMVMVFSKDPKAKEDYINYLNNAQVGGSGKDEFDEYLEKPATQKPTIQQPQQTSQTMQDIIGMIHGGSSEGTGNLQPEIMQGAQNAYTTAQNVGQVIPFADMVANLVTSAYGVPISGLYGLRYLPQGLNLANQKIQEAQDLLIYKPQTTGGQQLTQAAVAPMAPFDRLGTETGRYYDEQGYPMFGATIDSIIKGIPAILTGKAAIKSGTTAVISRVAAIEREISNTIREGVQRGLRPGITKGKARSFTTDEAFFAKQEKGVRKIVESKSELKLTDPEGNPVDKLPDSNYLASQAASQTRQKVLKEYMSDSANAGDLGASIDLIPMAEKLEKIAQDPVMITEAPEISAYAGDRALAYRRQGKYSPLDAEKAISLINSRNNSIRTDPKLFNSSMKMVDEGIANELRTSLSDTVDKFTGTNHQSLKDAWGGLKEFEELAAKRAALEMQKGPYGFFDLGGIYQIYHGVKGVLSKDPTTAVAAMTAKIMYNRAKAMNRPDRFIRNMFEKTDRLIDKRDVLVGTEGLSIPTMNQGYEPNTWNYKDMNSLEGVFNDLHKKGISPSELTGQMKSMYKKWEMSSMGLRPKMMTPARPTMIGRSLPELTPSGAEMAKNFTANFPQLLLPEKTPLPKSELIFRTQERIKAKRPMTAEEHMKQLKMRK